MRILIGQPTIETGISQLKHDVETNDQIDLVLYPEGYLDSESSLEEACHLAKEKSIGIISSLRKNKKDIAVSINPTGEVDYFRDKTSSDASTKLNVPLTYKLNRLTIGFLLCMEILKGVRDFPVRTDLDFIVHPIGVGMFSEEQFYQWISEAKKMAIRNKCFILGTSHADGSYKNCGVSIPIAYCFDSMGNQVFLSKNTPTSNIISL